MCESILHTRSHPSSSAESKPLTWQPPSAWQSTQCYLSRTQLKIFYLDAGTLGGDDWRRHILRIHGLQRWNI